MEGLLTKVCNGCLVEKLHEDFGAASKNSGDRYGLRSRCKECSRESRRKRYRDNPEKYKVWNKRWNLTNPDKRRALEQNRDRIKKVKSYKNWLKNNPEAKKALDHNYRARKVAAEGTLTRESINMVFEVYGKACLKCGSLDRIEIDHVVPLALGGTNLFDNLQPLCKSCNSSKGGRYTNDYRHPNLRNKKKIGNI